jgi:hypothetical protein
MTFNEVIAELPRLTFEERQILIRRALELEMIHLCQRPTKSWWKQDWRSITLIRVPLCGSMN